MAVIAGIDIYLSARFQGRGLGTEAVANPGRATGTPKSTPGRFVQVEKGSRDADHGSRHDLLLLTEGEVAEQRNKLDVSGLGYHFRSIHIVADQNVETYRQLVLMESLAPAHQLPAHQGCC